MYAVDIDGDVSDGDGVLVVSELHLQHALKAPAHEGDVRDPRGHWGVKNRHRYQHHILSNVYHFGPNPSLIHLLTQPHVLHVDDETSGQIEDSEQGIAHEG